MGRNTLTCSVAVERSPTLVHSIVVRGQPFTHVAPGRLADKEVKGSHGPHWCGPYSVDPLLVQHPEHLAPSCQDSDSPGLYYCSDRVLRKDGAEHILPRSCPSKPTDSFQIHQECFMGLRTAIGDEPSAASLMNY